jgi:hypothetical protein
MKVIEVKPVRDGWKVFEAPGVECRRFLATAAGITQKNELAQNIRASSIQDLICVVCY